MKKWYVAGGLILIVIVANVFFWQWTARDNGEQVVISDLKQWAEFKDGQISFSAPENFIQKVSPSGGQYWFLPEQNKTALVYEKFERAEQFDLLAQVRDNLNISEKCGKLSVAGKVNLIRRCQYLGSEFTFAFLASGGQVSIISIDHKYFSDSEIDYIINSIAVKQD